ncbi:hypothetical protein FGG08_003778 [Glutinoglossum americanum]|uniref:Uncharacterized protein n=1 Tax=Glutinoglossum americanum TaxID=1670608 RepID=A0A9P8I6E2_9PEZI|nr:hypothetical protein FGG08_003778 [Glutinoglossum americanum]
MLLLLLSVLGSLSSLAQAQGDTNATNGADAQCPVNIPGFTHHGNCNLLCRRASWIDVLVFFLGNYVAHAATVVSRPSQSVLSNVFNIMIALLFPGGGVRNGVEAILTLAKFAPTDLQVAARAGALCTVIKRIPDDVPAPSASGTTEADRPAKGGGVEIEIQQTQGEHARDCGNNNIDLETPTPKAHEPGQEEVRSRTEPLPLVAAKIHGRCRLPDGYDLVEVPDTATFIDDDKAAQPALSRPQRLWRWATAMFRAKPEPRTTVCCSYNFIKILVSIAQLLFTISTLYRTRGDQLDLYGYAAFGLTVAPYAWISFINLLGNLMRPQYDTIFVVESTDLDELRKLIAKSDHQTKERFTVTGTVGRLTVPAQADVRRIYDTTPRNLKTLFLASFFIGVIPIVIVGGFSSFAPGQSALHQRVWTMTWLVLGFFIGIGVGPLAAHIEDRPMVNRTGLRGRLFKPGVLLGVLVAVGCAATAIGGFVVVAQMILDFGVCFELRNSDGGVTL